MDYEEYYNSLLGELTRATVVLKEYSDLEDFFANSSRNKVTYEAYVLSSMPIGISDIVYIITSGNISLKFDTILHNTLKNNNRLAFTKGVLNLFKNEKTKILSIFKSLVEISNEMQLRDLLNDIGDSLNKNEYRLTRLKELMRK
ncbi:hypothetical protein [Pedobacter frigoris]|uniref:Uncharacterized protein n=1 Tax=Pedobacter frigoris TaxID=2571272 RepID=A0A4U1CFJ8_9SPHI|nr:hypothetical protein [Pedobacter frigoris]TKC03670.1 hypothetical protein FA047_19095 [Pedobacter frigoris]